MRWWQQKAGLTHADDRLTYRTCEALWERKASGRKYKRLSTWLRLRQDGENFIVTGRNQDSATLFTVRPDNTAIVHLANARNYLGRNSVVYHLHAYMGLSIWHQTDRRSTQQWWYRVKDGEKAPATDGMVVNLKTGAVLSELPVVKRRRAVLGRAKPIREKIADWERLARSYFATAEPTTVRANHDNAQPRMPDVGEEPTIDGLHGLIRTHVRHMWWWDRGDPGAVRDRIKAGFYSAFEKWKEQLYLQHGVYEWREVPLDKQAA